LWLGISGVGFLVVLSCALLVFQVPYLLFGDAGLSLTSSLAAFSAMAICYVVIMSPFDYAGGYQLPCNHSRICHYFSTYSSQWLRGAFVQSAILVLCNLIVLQAGLWGGRPLALLALFGCMTLMLTSKTWIARAVGGMRSQGRNAELEAWLQNVTGRRIPVRIYSAIDPGFAGAIAGLPGNESLVTPALWAHTLKREELQAELLHRAGAILSGSRTRGLGVAMLWNLLGYLLCTYLPGGGVSSVAQVLSSSLWFVLWSFVGLLLLPTLSRRGVYEADRFALQNGAEPADFRSMVVRLDQLQDDEPVRAPRVEAIFHPLPSVETRLRAAQENASGVGAWHAARYALYLSWPCFGVLARAVHCNSGRPELWVMLPAN
jgi:Zn-dependent protease with chaperone function